MPGIYIFVIFKIIEETIMYFKKYVTCLFSKLNMSQIDTYIRVNFEIIKKMIVKNI